MLLLKIVSAGILWTAPIRSDVGIITIIYLTLYMENTFNRLVYHSLKRSWKNKELFHTGIYFNCMGVIINYNGLVTWLYLPSYLEPEQLYLVAKQDHYSPKLPNIKTIDHFALMKLIVQNEIRPILPTILNWKDIIVPSLSLSTNRIGGVPSQQRRQWFKIASDHHFHKRWLGMGNNCCALGSCALPGNNVSKGQSGWEVP